MKIFSLLVLIYSFNLFAEVRVGGYFYNSQTKDQVRLLCADIDSDNPDRCTEAFLFVIPRDGSRPHQLHDHKSFPMDASSESLAARYYYMTVVKNATIQRRSFGALPWVMYNTLKLNYKFNKSLEILFTQNENDFNKAIKLTPKNFKAMIQSIEELL